MSDGFKAFTESVRTRRRRGASGRRGCRRVRIWSISRKGQLWWRPWIWMDRRRRLTAGGDWGWRRPEPSTCCGRSRGTLGRRRYRHCTPTFHCPIPRRTSWKWRTSESLSAAVWRSLRWTRSAAAPFERRRCSCRSRWLPSRRWSLTDRDPSAM